jgi:hypothetical protein
MSLPCSRLLFTALLGAASASAWPAGQVHITGQLTSFQSALNYYGGDGNGTLNGEVLVIDPGALSVSYQGGSNRYPQSTTVNLPAGTQRVQFEYTDGLGPQAVPNVVSFQVAGPALVDVGDVFKVGTLRYTNGFWYPFARVGLRIEVSSEVPALDGHSFQGSIVVAVSSPEPYVPEPVSNADYFYLEDATGPLGSLGSVRVYEAHVQPVGNPGNTGTVDLYARIGSLIPQRFDNPSAGAFLSTSLEPLPAVPEPSTYALMLGGLALAAGLARRRKAQSSTTTPRHRRMLAFGHVALLAHPVPGGG